MRRLVDDDRQQPVLEALLRKMSAISVLMTARKPKSSSAHGACSRDEPQPKLRPATRIWQPRAGGLVQHEVGLAARRRRRSASRRTALRRARRASVVVRKRAGMIWSVSMFVAGSTTVRERMTVTGCMALLALQRRNSRGSVIRPRTAAAAAVSGTREQRARARALPALEVAIARADAVLARRDQVAVHAEAHRAAGLAPLGARVDEDLVRGPRPRPRA